jgi:hypothetical protein
LSDVSTTRLALALSVALAGAAHAGPLSEALVKHDVAALRAQLADPAARCTLGVVFAEKADLPRAVTIVGWLHGILFMAFLVVLMQARDAMKWHL